MNRDDAAKAAAAKWFERGTYSDRDAEQEAKNWLEAQHPEEAMRFRDTYRSEMHRLRHQPKERTEA